MTYPSTTPAAVRSRRRSPKFRRPSVSQITLQMIRPAEFIEMTFKQMMQGAG